MAELLMVNTTLARINLEGYGTIAAKEMSYVFY